MAEQNPTLSSSLALALSGFDVEAASELSGLRPGGRARRSARHGRLKQVTASVTPLVKHAQLLGRQLLAASAAPGADCAPLVEQLEGLCFGLRSTLGLSGRLPPEEELAVWNLSTELWVGGRTAQVGC